MTDTELALLHRPPLQPAESLPSYLMRLAIENYYPSSMMVMHLCRARLSQRDTITQPTQAETYRVLSALMKVEAEALYSASVHRFASTLVPPTEKPPILTLPSGKTAPALQGAFLRDHTWPQSDVQFCPHCLQQAAYHRLTWTPLAVAVCLHHHCLLVRGCPQCGQAISMAALLNAQCPTCHFALTQAPVWSVDQDPFGLFSQTVLQAWLGLGSNQPTTPLFGLPHQPPAILYRVVDGLRRTIMSLAHPWPYLYQPPSGAGQPFFPCLTKRDMTPAKAYLLFATALKGLLNWPHGFCDFLDAYRQREGPVANIFIQQELAYIYVVNLQKRWRHPAFRFVQDAFDQYLLDTYPASSLAGRVQIDCG